MNKEKKKSFEYVKELEESKEDLKRKLWKVEDKLNETKVAKEKKEIEQEIKEIEKQIDELKPEKVRTYGDPCVIFD